MADRTVGGAAGAVSRRHPGAPYGAWLAGAVLLSVQAVVVIFHLRYEMRMAVPALLVEGAVYAVIVHLVLSGRLTIGLPALLAVAAAMRVPLWFADPHFSTDIYRYIWDGRVQAAGINPYLYIPNDPALASLRDGAIWPLVNRGDYALTIYPPAAELFFFLATRLGETVWIMKGAFLATEMVALACLIALLNRAGMPRDRAVLLAWSPLAALEIAGSGHVDALMMMLVMVALLLDRAGSRWSAGSAFGAAVLVKFLPLALVPALWRRGAWQAALAAGLVMALLYAAYGFGAGTNALGFLPGYAGEEGISDGSGFWALRVLRALTGLAIPTMAYLVVSALFLASISLVVMMGQRQEASIRGALWLATAAMLVISPAYSWYFVWLLPLVALQPGSRLAWPVIWLAASSPLLYSGNARVELWQLDIVYGGFCLVALTACCIRGLPLRRHEVTS